MVVVKINKSFLNDNDNVINENVEYTITEPKNMEPLIFPMIIEIFHIINYKFAVFTGKELWKEKEIYSGISTSEVSFEIKVKKSFEKSIKELLQTLVEKTLLENKLSVYKLVGTKNLKNKIISIFKIDKKYIQIDFLITEDKVFALSKKMKNKVQEPILVQ